MAINPSDTSYAIVKEVTAGTTPATPAFLDFPYIPGDDIQAVSDFVESQVQRSNRASAGARKNNLGAEGGIKTHLKRDAAIDLLLESGLSGTFQTNTLKAGKTDTSLTVEKKMVDGASNYFKRFTGCQVNKVTLTCEASGNAEIAFGVIGVASTPATTIITGATYANSASTTNLCGLDVGTFTVAGLTLVFRSLELTIEHTRERQDRFGSASAVGVGTSGFRKVMLTATAYRTDWTPETVLIPDTPVAVSFSIGTGANGYTFTLPACYSMMPEDQADGSKQLVRLQFMAAYDNTAATDLQITRP